jgi:hopanoid-associated phosphorylase
VETREASVIAVTGLVFEARIAARSRRVRTLAGGGDAARLRSRLDRDCKESCAGIISFGIAGALDPSLKPGDIVLAGCVMGAVQRWECDPAWRAHMSAKLGPVASGAIFGSDHPIVTSADKARIYRDTGAVAVDMESHAAAEVAARHGLPFVALRVIADDAASAIPRSALAGMRSDGTTDVKAVLTTLVRNPGDVGALIRLGAATGTARASLLRCLGLLGPGLGRFDLG